MFVERNGFLIELTEQEVREIHQKVQESTFMRDVETHLEDNGDEKFEIGDLDIEEIHEIAVQYLKSHMNHDFGYWDNLDSSIIYAIDVLEMRKDTK